jgi:cytochrome P450
MLVRLLPDLTIQVIATALTKIAKGTFIKAGLSKEECEAEAFLQLGAGSDTSAVAMRVTISYLISTPRAYFRLKEEIRDWSHRSEASGPIKAEQARKLPYLQVS